MAVDRRAIGGPSARVIANGKEVGWAEAVSGTEDITNNRVKVLGDIDAQELVPGDRRVDFTCNFVRIREEHLTAMKIWPRGDSKAVMSFPALVFEVVDEDGNAIERILGAKPKRRAWSVDAGGLYTEQCGWDALRTEPVLGT